MAPPHGDTAGALARRGGCRGDRARLRGYIARLPLPRPRSGVRGQESRSGPGGAARIRVALAILTSAAGGQHRLARGVGAAAGLSAVVPAGPAGYAARLSPALSPGRGRGADCAAGEGAAAAGSGGSEGAGRHGGQGYPGSTARQRHYGGALHSRGVMGGEAR